MQTTLSPEFGNSAPAAQAEAILRSCVHCGFCNATCPTYQLLGDELDGPRGRIYLIKQMLEGGDVGRSTQQHLDRCLTCLNCETTCPSGVEYGRLVTIGRDLVDARVQRPWNERLMRWLLREGLNSVLFAPLLGLAQRSRRLLPAALRNRVPRAAAQEGGTWPTTEHPRKVLLLGGCVQPAMRPNINAATARVLDAAAIQTLVAPGAGCCGALREHLSDVEGGRANARRNIDAWMPLIEAGGVEAIVANASACGLAIKQYGEALSADPSYRDKAARVSAIARDLSELLPELTAILEDRLQPRGGKLVTGDAPARLAVHAPCTLQHGQKLRGGVERDLARLGFDVQVPGDAHLCCGSAGTYSVLQPALARELRDRKLKSLLACAPQAIVSANIGCIAHLQSGTQLPVRHWIEVLDESLRLACRGT